MQHFTAIENHSKKEIEELIESARGFKKNRFGTALKGKTLIALFFNPSTRTRVSFDLAMHELGGHAIALAPGSSSWGIEVNEGAVMDGEAEEHLKDVTKVLCRYGDALAIRCFPKFKDWKEEKKDAILSNMVKWSDKPVINMETISHPCQALAMMMTLKEKLKGFKGKKMALTWVYHPKPLNTAVANSAGMIASICGMDLAISNPKGYDLDGDYLAMMKGFCEKNGAKFSVSNSMEDALKDADFVYAKSWGPLSQYGNFKPHGNDKFKHWIVDKEKMNKTNNGYFSHCLPMRRNVKATDEVVDSGRSLIYEEAENRLHVQKAVLAKLIGGKK
jgi:N-acetylornithine carbamoyltransferase